MTHSNTQVLPCLCKKLTHSIQVIVPRVNIVKQIFYYIYLLHFSLLLLLFLKCTSQSFTHEFSNSEVILQICCSLTSSWAYYGLIFHWLENDSGKDNNGLPYRIVLGRCMMDSLKNALQMCFFVILILYISRVDFLSKNSKSLTYGRPDPLGV